jgi:hypothetical protein
VKVHQRLNKVDAVAQVATTLLATLVATMAVVAVVVKHQAMAVKVL